MDRFAGRAGKPARQPHHDGLLADAGLDLRVGAEIFGRDDLRAGKPDGAMRTDSGRTPTARPFRSRPAGAPAASPDCPSSNAAEITFIGGAPMKRAVNTVAGRS